MKTSKQYDTLIAICTIRLLKGIANVQDIKILTNHVDVLVGDPKILKNLYKAHSKSKA